MHIGLSLAPTWLSGDAWRRPDSDIEQIFSSHYYVDIARRAEQAKLDFVFRPDTLFLDAQALPRGPGFSSLDPTILLASIARETTHIGLLTTVSTTFMPPYVIARQIQSLHRLSLGRAGWNIVTALDGNENFGLPNMPSSDDRYARARECTAIVRQLWASYPASAIKIDRQTGVYADPTMVRPIAHQSQQLRVKGPLNIPAWPGAPIPLIQAGASAIGRDFAASIADAVFASTPDIESARELRQDLHRRATGHGRDAADVRVLPGLSLFLAETRDEAADLFLATHSRTDSARKFAYVKELIGLDLTHWPRDRRITSEDLQLAPVGPRSRTHAELLSRLIARSAPTVADLLNRPEVIGSAHWQIIGTAADAVEQIATWFQAGAIDGFIALPGGSVSSLRLFLEAVIPRLADLGLFRRDYRAATFMEHLRDDNGRHV